MVPASHQHNMTARPSASMEIPEDERPRTQVERIAAKFGSVNKLHKALRRCGQHLAKNAATPAARAMGAKLARIDRSTVYRWNTNGGLVPARKVDLVNKAARLEGIVLTDEDWSPARK